MPKVWKFPLEQWINENCLYNTAYVQTETFTFTFTQQAIIVYVYLRSNFQDIVAPVKSCYNATCLAATWTNLKICASNKGYIFLQISCKPQHWPQTWLYRWKANET